MAKIKKVDESIRETKRDREHFNKCIALWTEKIKDEEELLAENKDEAHKEWYQHRISMIYVYYCEIANAMYSRGDSLESVRECFQKAWDKGQEDEWFIDTGHYYRVAFAYCLGFDTSKALALLQAISDSKEIKKRKKYPSHEFIPFFIASQGKISELGDYILEKWIYEDLEKFILEGRNIEYFHSFLKKWYRRYASGFWAGSWKHDSYTGCWNYVAGAVVKILGLNKDEFREDRYFPYDLA